MVPRTIRNQLFEEQSALIDKTMNRYYGMIRACHLCQEDVRQELALQMLLCLEEYDPLRCPNLAAYLALYLRYALLELALPSKRYGIPHLPVEQKVPVVSLDDSCCRLSGSWDPYAAVEIWDEIYALPPVQRTAIRRLLYGERLHCTNKALASSRKHLRQYTGAPGTRYRIKKEGDPYAKAENGTCSPG